MSLIRKTALTCAAVLVLACAGDPPMAPESPPSAGIAPATAALLAAPTNLAAKANSSAAITVTWTDKSSGETGFEIWRSTTGSTGTFSKRTTTGANAKTWKDTGLTTMTQYCYQGRAAGATPSAFTSAACATTLLKTPIDFAARLSASTAILLTWTDKLTGEAGFEVWRSTTGSGGTYTRVASVPANTTYANDAGLSRAAGYCYKVRALGTAGLPTSLFSTMSCARRPRRTFMVRAVLFGDSNTDRCEDRSAESDPRPTSRSSPGSSRATRRYSVPWPGRWTRRGEPRVIDLPRGESRDRGHDDGRRRVRRPRPLGLGRAQRAHPGERRQPVRGRGAGSGLPLVGRRGR